MPLPHFEPVDSGNTFDHLIQSFHSSQLHQFLILPINNKHLTL